MMAEATNIQMPGQLLNLRSVSAAYGKGQVLWDVAFDLNKGDSATVLGRNGVGKTTLMKTIMGQLPVSGGHIYWHGDEVTEMKAHQRSRAGIGFVPQGRHVFPHLTVRENLEVGLSALSRPGFSGPKKIPDMVFELFPKLTQIANRKAGVCQGESSSSLRLAGHWPVSPSCCCSTNRPRASSPTLSSRSRTPCCGSATNWAWRS